MEPTSRGAGPLGDLLADLARLLADADALRRQIAARLAIMEASRSDEREVDCPERVVRLRRLNGKAG